MAEWEADIKIRRNGRLVERYVALGDRPETALYFAHNDILLWAQAHPENSERYEHEGSDHVVG